MKIDSYVLLSLLFLIGCTPNLENLVKTQQFDEILEWRESMKYDWSEGWNLDSCANQQIDHYILGSNLYWSKVTDSFRYTRSESYTSDKLYYSFQELKFTDDSIKSGTYFRFRNDRGLYYKKVAIYNNSSDSSDRYFHLHLFESDSLVSTYKTSSYHVDLVRGRFDFAIDKFPNDLKLIFGKDLLFELHKEF